MGIIKDYKLNVGVFVMYHSLEAIHSNYYGTLTKDVERQTNKLLNVLIDSLPSDPVYRDYDYEDVEYYMRQYMRIILVHLQMLKKFKHLKLIHMIFKGFY